MYLHIGWQNQSSYGVVEPGDIPSYFGACTNCTYWWTAFKTLLLLTTRPAACCLSLSLSPVYITPTCAMFYWSERCVYICMCVSVCVFLPTCAHSFCMLFLVRVRSRLFQGVCIILYVSVCAFSSYLCMSVCWNVFQWLWRCMFDYLACVTQGFCVCFPTYVFVIVFFDVCLYIFLCVHLVRTLTVKDRS